MRRELWSFQSNRSKYDKILYPIFSLSLSHSSRSFRSDESDMILKPIVLSLISFHDIKVRLCFYFWWRVALFLGVYLGIDYVL